MQTETTAPVPDVEQLDAVVPDPDLSVLTAEQPPVEAGEAGKDDKPAPPQELADTTPASVGLVVALVVISVVAAVVVAMWMVSPLMALLLGAGLIVVAVLAGAGFLAWRKFTRRSKAGRDRDGAGRDRDRAGRGDRGGKTPGGGKSNGGLWPFNRNKNGGKTPGGKAPGGGGKPAGDGPKKKPTSDKSGGGWWPFSRNKAPGGGNKPSGGGKAPGGGAKPAGDGPTKKKPASDKAGGGRWPFSRNKAPGGGNKPSGGGKAPGGGAKPAGDGPTKKKPASDKSGGDAGRKAKSVGGAALLGLIGLARKAKKSKDSKATDGKAPVSDSEPVDADDAATGRARPAPGGHRPETVIDVDLDDITPAPGPAGSSSTRPTESAGPQAAPFDSGSTAAGSGWWDRPVPTSLPSTPVSHLGGVEMSTTTTSVDQDAMRVANRYAGLIAKAETLMDRARACRDAAGQYRRDARDNQESAENHKQAARTIRDANIAHGHAVAAREAEAEAAREILAARHYEAQAEQYEAQARAI